MIYSDNKEKDHQAFLILLENTRISVLESIDVSKINNGDKFEAFTYEKMCECAKNTLFNGTLKRTKDRAFPDIIAKQFLGVEVKFTKEDKWTSIGNSILESSRVSDVEYIYMFFGKCGGTPDVKYRKYEECLSGISVTHYPRYTIDMTLEKGNSIFENIGISYEVLRNESNPIKPIREYYKKHLKKNNSLWWIDEPDVSSEKPRTLIIKSFSNLSDERKNNLIAEGFILYPEVLSRNQDKYARLCSFWMSYHSTICPNMRDHYSAGGKFKISTATEEDKIIANKMDIVEAEKVIYNLLFKYHSIVKEILEKIDLSLVSECWEKDLLDREEMKREWEIKIDAYTQHYGYKKKLSEMFNLAQ